MGKGKGNVHHKGAAERQKGKIPPSVSARAGRGTAGTPRRVHSRVIAENTWSVTWSGFVCCSGTGAIYAPPPAPGASPQRTTSRGWSVQKDGSSRLENAIPAGTRLLVSCEAALRGLAAGACLAPASGLGLGVSRMRPRWHLRQGLEHLGPCGSRQEPHRRLCRRRGEARRPPQRGTQGVRERVPRSTHSKGSPA